MIGSGTYVAKTSARNGSVPAIREGFRFGRFALDIRARELRKDGYRIRLQDQPFDVLLMLLQQPGEVLSRDDLRCRLWPDGTFVDFEHGLNAAVKRLRSAIGDKADQPRFVETLHRRGYRFIASVERIGLGAPERPGEKPRLAVLPFSDLGEQNNHAYFSEGLTEEMIIQLGRRCGNRLAVVAQNSAKRARNKAITIRGIGEMLNVGYVLEGSVRREANRVRITAQLIESASETQVWADTYERDLSDCFLVQADVASRIAHALALELLPGPANLGCVGTRHLAAHQAYLKGLYHWNRPADEGLLEAVSHYEQALALDPEFASARSALGRAYVAAAGYYMREPRPMLEAARGAAMRALELDRTDANAHLTLAEVYKSVDWDWGKAEEAYRLALSFNPSSEAAHRLYGLFLADRRRPAEAALSSVRAYELDPLCLVVNTSAAWVRYLDGDYVESTERCRLTLGMSTNFIPAQRVLAAALFQLGRTDEAIATLERALADNEDPVSVAWLVHMLGTTNGVTRAAALMERLRSAASHRYVSPYHLALACIGLGNADGAVEALNEACDVRDPSLTNLATEPRFAPLHADPRYRSLVSRLGLL
jgi:TolB-like protein/tetratricopeptide (TPR) repeat protein